MASGAYLMNLGRVPYEEAWDLQRSLAAAVGQGPCPETVIFLEHPPTITLGRRTEEGEMHVPDGADGRRRRDRPRRKSTFHGPGQLVCYPILDLKLHGKDVKRYCRDLEEAIIRTVAAFGVEATRIDGLTGVWLPGAAAQDRVDRRARLALGLDARLRAQRRPRPGAVHGLDHRLRARGRDVHDARARARPAGDARRGAARRAATRSPRCSGWSSRSCRATSPASGRSRCTRSSPRTLIALQAAAGGRRPSSTTAR